MKKDPETLRRERISDLKNAYQGDIWAFAEEQSYNRYHELLARIDDLYSAMNCLRDDWKLRKNNLVADSSPSLTPSESEDIYSEEEKVITRQNEEIILDRLRNDQLMMIEESPWGENQEDHDDIKMMIEDSHQKPPLTRYEKRKPYKPKFKKIYRIKKPPTEDRMMIEKPLSQNQQPQQQIPKKQIRKRFRRIYLRIKKPKVFVKVYVPKTDMLIENENLEWRMNLRAPQNQIQEEFKMVIENEVKTFPNRKRERPSYAEILDSSGSPPPKPITKMMKYKGSSNTSPQTRVKFSDFFKVKFKFKPD